MTDAQLFTILKVLAVVLFITQTLITQAITNFTVDLGFTRVQVAVLSLLANGMGLALIYLPQINRSAGNTRGDSTDDR